MLARFVDTGVFDVLLSHNRYTLLDRSAGDLFTRAAGMGLGVVNAAVFGGGSWPRAWTGYRGTPTRK